MCGRFSLGATIRVGQLFDVPNWTETPQEAEEQNKTYLALGEPMT